MRLEWSPYAIADREQIFDYIEQDNPLAAVAIDDRISGQVRILMDFPESGRPGRIDGTREWVIHNTPYIAAYCITGDVVRILRVLHSAQLWPDEIPKT